MRSLKGYTSPGGASNVHVSLMEAQDITFRIRAVRGAVVQLLTTPYGFDAPSYILHIGSDDNTKTKLHVQSPFNETHVEVSTPQILDVVELRSFWMSWHDGLFQFGSGMSIGSQPLLTFVDAYPDLRQNFYTLALSSAGDSIFTEWEFGEHIGEYIARQRM